MLEYFNDKPNLTKESHQQLGAELMKRCNQKSKEKCESIESQNIQEEIKWTRVKIPQR